MFPLVVAFNLAATNLIVVAIGSWIFLGEEISIRRWVGISLIALGAGFIARPLTRVGGENMTLFLFCLIVFYASCSVAGQLLFKRAMSEQVNTARRGGSSISPQAF